jgi:TRAP-type uncharacterized transport system substrate-binding protein
MYRLLTREMNANPMPMKSGFAFIMKYTFMLVVISISTSCDVLYKQKKLRIAVAVNDNTSASSAAQLKAFLENGGYELEIISVATTIEANERVARAEADITFALSHSLFMPTKLGEQSNELRTIMPLFEPAMFLFSRDSTIKETSSRLFSGKKVGIEKIAGEAHINFEEIMHTGKMDSVEFTENWEGDFFHFWGTSHGKMAKNAVGKNWTPVSLDDRLRDFLLVNYPSLHEFTLPAFPGDPESRPIKTLSSQTLLICNSGLSERTVYDLSEYIYKHKLELMLYDRMYYSINEAFNHNRLLYPLHRGADAYLRRDEPAFLERYADAIALVITVIALSFGATQTARNFFSSRQKIRLQQYFIKFLAIRENAEMSSEERSKNLNALLQETLRQVTQNKLDKNDFHIFSSLVHQEFTMLKS